MTRLAELGVALIQWPEIGRVENKLKRNGPHSFGDNHFIVGAVKKYGGQIISNRHIDLVANNITLQLDAEVVEF